MKYTIRVGLWATAVFARGLSMGEQQAFQTPQVVGRDAHKPARSARPARWSGSPRNCQPIGSVWLKPERSEAGHWANGPLMRSRMNLAAPDPWLSLPNTQPENKCRP